MNRSHCSAIRRTPGEVARRRSARAFTLVEMLVAMALTLLLVLSVTQVFQLLGENVMAGRAVVEMSGQLRDVTHRLQRDIDGLTVQVRPWPTTASGQGYFEYHEGPFWDLGIGPVRFTETSMGDIDDVLMFTSHSDAAPFLGQVLGSIIPDPTNPARWVVSYDPANPTRTPVVSRDAEILWFTRFNDRNANGLPEPGEVSLHRRALLILPNLDLSDPDVRALTPGQFFHGFDVSVAISQTAPASWVKNANSLDDLTRRENRTAHYNAGGYPITSADPPMVQPAIPFPFRISRALLVPQGSVITPGPDGAWGATGVDDDANGSQDTPDDGGVFGTDDLTRSIDSVIPGPIGTFFAESYGNDVMLPELLGFDVRAYDPTAVLQRQAGGTDPLIPGDPNYQPMVATAAFLGQGDYVDLFYARYVGGVWPPPLPGGGQVSGVSSLFAGPPQVRSGLIVGGLAIARQPSVYDTWPMYYEHDGLDQDGVGGIDQGTNGLDDDNLNGVDDARERETSPPYPVPLRGIQVKLRIYDPDTRQVRQVSVTSDFIPE